MKKIAIVTSHPIQYNAPWFALLNKSNILKPKVFYTWSQSQQGDKFDPGFQKKIKWDLPLLDGYEHVFVPNVSKDPGTHHFKGLINPTLNKAIEEYQPDAILVFGWNFQSHLKCLRYFHKKIPVLFRGDSTLLDNTSRVKTFLRHLFLKWVYSNIDFALYTGINNKNYFLTNGLKERQLIYAPHAIDNNRFSQDSSSYDIQIAALRNQLGIREHDIVLMFAGKLEEKKNPFFLLELMKKNRSQNLKVLFVGNGKLENKLKATAENDERILFMDFQNQLQMPFIYRVADLLVLPSTGPGETWGLALNEAMACGKAVAASNKTGGAIDLIKDWENGLIIDLDNSNEFERFIERALQEPSILAEMGRKSGKMIKDFNYTRIVNAIEQLVGGF